MPTSNPTSSWDAREYAAHGRFVADHGSVVLEMLDPQSGERILDLGCGDGALTARISAAGAQVLGVDASPELVAAARRAGITAQIGDGADLRFEQEFDAVFSNAALHWMLEPQLVADGMFRALRPGGRLVVEFGGFGNIAAIRTALSAVLANAGFTDTDPGQYYPTAAQYHAVLTRAGFQEVHTMIVPRQTLLPGAMGDWLRTFRSGFLDAHEVPAPLQAEVITQTERALAPSLHDPLTDQWYADYVRLRATARRPA